MVQGDVTRTVPPHEELVFRRLSDTLQQPSAMLECVGVLVAIENVNLKVFGNQRLGYVSIDAYQTKLWLKTESYISALWRVGFT